MMQQQIEDFSISSITSFIKDGIAPFPENSPGSGDKDYLYLFTPMSLLITGLLHLVSALMNLMTIAVFILTSPAAVLLWSIIAEEERLSFSIYDLFIGGLKLCADILTHLSISAINLVFIPIALFVFIPIKLSLAAWGFCFPSEAQPVLIAGEANDVNLLPTHPRSPISMHLNSQSTCGHKDLSAVVDSPRKSRMPPPKS